MKRIKRMERTERIICALFLILVSVYFIFDAALVNAADTPASQDAVQTPQTPAQVPAQATKAEENDPEKVLAKVEGKEIKEKDVNQTLAAAGPQAMMTYDNEQGRKAILEDLIAAQLFALSGKKQGLDNTPEFKSLLENFTTQALARAAIEVIVQDITATEEECKKFYDENPDQFKTQDEINASHILLTDDTTSADKIALIQAELKKGISFDVLAKAHSIDPTAAQNSGNLGFFSKGQMVPEFEEAAFALKEPGDISAPIKSNFGWHIIRLEEKKPSSVMSYDEVKTQLLQFVSNEKKSKKYQEVLAGLRKEYKVEIQN